ncbi:ferric uptake regulation protein [Candidatus Mycobacterium wuenschmannii]|uniref:Ferric uptake regulation protein n=1 Tax=Candidatus Mycobacterium wuenschmannii TaxID=3027808 RepID=A0ABY8VUZ9_9MYCO|nr:ferric uptake regulation protein [Candidatus Mycobacterium wuenschmannii]WIM86766.1 ferric uptake regulation protein [Candidatus Mycobacterium wuenschmannii]
MATKTKVKTCVHCGHSFDPNNRWRDLANPGWHSVASNYCSHECCDQYHRDMSHCCSSHAKDKERRQAVKASR